MILIPKGTAVWVECNKYLNGIETRTVVDWVVTLEDEIHDEMSNRWNNLFRFKLPLVPEITEVYCYQDSIIK